jgi:hypothetical protein
MQRAAKLTYDLTSVPETEFERLRMSHGRQTYYQARLTFHLLVKKDVAFWVTLGARELARVIIPYP